MEPRRELSEKHIKGSGIEIGGLHFPLPVLPGCKVAYIDRMTLEELRVECPDVVPKDLEIIVDDAETLATVPSSSQDFVIANHVFEHCQNPIGTLKTWLRVLKPGGIIYAAIPEKTETFDRDRAITTVDHLFKDHIEGPWISQADHYRDWHSHIEKLSGDALEERVKLCMETNANVHFHVWDEPALRELFDVLGRILPFEILEGKRNGSEMIWVFRKLPVGFRKTLTIETAREVYAKTPKGGQAWFVSEDGHVLERFSDIFESAGFEFLGSTTIGGEIFLKVLKRTCPA